MFRAVTGMVTKGHCLEAAEDKVLVEGVWDPDYGTDSADGSSSSRQLGSVECCNPLTGVVDFPSPTRNAASLPGWWILKS